MSSTRNEALWIVDCCCCLLGGLVIGRLEFVWHEINRVSAASCRRHHRLLEGSHARRYGTGTGAQPSTTADCAMGPGHCMRLLLARFISLVVSTRACVELWVTWEEEGVTLAPWQQVLAAGAAAVPVALFLVHIAWQVYAPADFAARHSRTVHQSMAVAVFIIVCQSQSGHPRMVKSYRFELLHWAVRLMLYEPHPFDFASQLGVTCIAAMLLHLYQLSSNTTVEADPASEAVYFMTAYPLLMCMHYAYLYLIGADVAHHHLRHLLSAGGAAGSAAGGEGAPVAFFRPLNATMIQGLSGESGRRTFRPQPLLAPSDSGASAGQASHHSAQTAAAAAAAAAGTVAPSPAPWPVAGSSAASENQYDPHHHSGRGGGGGAPAAAPDGAPSMISSLGGAALGVESSLQRRLLLSQHNDSSRSATSNTTHGGLVPTGVLAWVLSAGGRFEWTATAYLVFDRIYLLKLCVMRTLMAFYLTLSLIEHLRLLSDGAGPSAARRARGLGGKQRAAGEYPLWVSMLPMILGIPFLNVLCLMNIILPFKRQTVGLYSRHSTLINNAVFYAMLAVRMAILLIEPWWMNQHTIFRSSIALTMTSVVQEDPFMLFLFNELVIIVSLLSVKMMRMQEFQGLSLPQVMMVLPEYFVVLIAGVVLHCTVNGGKFNKMTSSAHTSSSLSTSGRRSVPSGILDEASRPAAVTDSDAEGHNDGGGNPTADAHDGGAGTDGTAGATAGTAAAAAAADVAMVRHPHHTDSDIGGETAAPSRGDANDAAMRSMGASSSAHGRGSSGAGAGGTAEPSLAGPPSRVHDAAALTVGRALMVPLSHPDGAVAVSTAAAPATGQAVLQDARGSTPAASSPSPTTSLDEAWAAATRSTAAAPARGRLVLTGPPLRTRGCEPGSPRRSITAALLSAGATAPGGTAAATRATPPGSPLSVFNARDKTSGASTFARTSRVAETEGGDAPGDEAGWRQQQQQLQQTGDNITSAFGTQAAQGAASPSSLARSSEAGTSAGAAAAAGTHRWRVLRVLDGVAFRAALWIRRRAIAADAVVWPKVSALHEFMVPSLVQVMRHILANRARRTAACFVVWSAVIFFQQGVCATPKTVQHATPAPPLTFLNEMAAPSSALLTGAAWYLLDLPRPPSPLVLMLMPHRVAMLFFHKCLWLHRCVPTVNTLLLSAFNLQLSVVVGYVAASVFVNMVPRHLNLNAAAAACGGQAISTPVRVGLWVARTHTDATRTATWLVLACLGLLHMRFWPLTRLEDEAQFLQLTGVLLKVIGRFSGVPPSAFDFASSPEVAASLGLSQGLATKLLVALLVGSSIVVYRVLQMTSYDVWASQNREEVMLAVEQVGCSDADPRSTADELCEALREQSQDLFQDMTVAIYMAHIPRSGRTGASEVALQQDAGGAPQPRRAERRLLLVQRSEYMLDALDEDLARSVYECLPSLPAGSSVWLERDLAASARVRPNGSTTIAVLSSVSERLKSSVKALSSMVAPLAVQAARVQAVGCLILLSPLPDAFDASYYRLAEALAQRISGLLWSECPPEQSIACSASDAPMQLQDGLVSAAQFCGDASAVSDHVPQGLFIDTNKFLGSGSSAKVYKGVYDGRPVAIKIIVHKARRRRLIENEVELSKNLSHPHIVKTIDSVNFQMPRTASSALGAQTSFVSQSTLDDDRPLPSAFSLDGTSDCDNMIARIESTEAAGGSGLQTSASMSAAQQQDHQTWIIMEFMDGGSLAQSLRQNIRRQPERPDLRDVLERGREVASGMAYLHSRNMIHGDLKSLNVLLMTDPTGKSPQGMVAKVADFGLSRHLTIGRTHLSTRTFGTLTHMPRELLMQGRLTDKVDVYSWGILLWEMLCRSAPYPGLSHGEIVYRKVTLNEHPPLPPWLPQCVADLALACWDQDPRKRPSFDDIIVRLDALLSELDRGGSSGLLGTLVLGPQDTLFASRTMPASAIYKLLDSP